MAIELFSSGFFGDANLVAYYRFLTGALITDSKGSFTLTNNNTVGETASGKFGYASDFSATNSNKSLTITNDLGITGGACTLNCWVKNLAEIGADAWGYVHQQDGGIYVVNQIFYDYNGGTRRLVFDRTRNFVANNRVYHTITMGTTDWYMLTMTYDTANVRGYVNGDEVGTPAASSGNGTTAGVDRGIVGAAAGSDGTLAYYASSQIDDVAVFTRALSASEISRLYLSSAKSLFFQQI